ncbi:MAG: hypothetical protein IJG86_09800 [Clostridia bacterium]|nr:hypothetical protein [Clostridia bacterium]
MTHALCAFAEGFSCARTYRLTQADAVNGSRARALAARPPNLWLSLAHLRNISPWKEKKHTKTQKSSWIEHSIGPKQEKSMISSCLPEIHRLSQNWQNAKSMISSCFLEIHRLSRNSKTQSR